uniref:Trophoblast glycoprotein b n=1 Tax=Nothobranchius rachovii TaxID=451742 RepID=A0A1A8P8H6_9TELE
MRLWSAARNRGEDPGRHHQRSGMMRLLFLLALMVPSCAASCPDKCTCLPQTVKCQNQGLDEIPPSIPTTTKVLFVTGNSISRISEASFPSRLDLLTDLYLSGNKMEHVDAVAFKNLPNLTKLDLSDNRIQSFSNSSFPGDNKLQFLNLSGSLNNHNLTDEVLSLFHSAKLLNLTTLDLSNNYLVTLPDGVFSSLSSLTTLNLRNSSVLTIHNLTLPLLRDLDLRNNSMRDLPPTTLADFSLNPDLHIQLAENPWHCNCFIEDLLAWLKNSTQVVDVQNLTCADPEAFRHRLLLQVEPSKLKCYTDMESVLETSYLFLGLVLALIGVIFLLVLYLNKKGIRRWMHNIRDACRDHMEGYHYRYEINCDPRLTNLSINSDV